MCELHYKRQSNLFHDKNNIKRVFVFLDPRSSALILGPSTLDPHLVVRRPQKHCKNKFMNKHITYSRLYLLNTKILYLFKIFNKLFSVQNKWKGSSSQHCFFINSKRNGKNFMLKYIQ